MKPHKLCKFCSDRSTWFCNIIKEQDRKITIEKSKYRYKVFIVCHVRQNAGFKNKDIAQAIIIEKNIKWYKE